jgi:hypothetical protein
MFRSKIRTDSGSTKGIIILTTLIAILFLVMFSSVIFTKTMLHQQNSFRAFQDEAVRKSAEAGVAYAMMRLEMEPGWQGCLPAEKPGEPGIAFHIDNPGTGLTVYEHPVADNKGWVEGRINTGGYDCYFILYFASPTLNDDSHFFGDGKPGGKLPENILLCKNNLSITTSPSDAEYSDGTIDKTKKIAVNSVLIVSTGSISNTARTVETSFRMERGLTMSSVVVSRGDLKTEITGDPSEGNRLSLVRSETGPSIMRAVGKLDILGLGYFLNIGEKCGGKADGNVRVSANDSQKNRFVQEPGQVNFIPNVSPEEAVPDSVSSSITHSLKPGTYIISFMPKTTDTDYMKYPKVEYIARDDTTLATSKDKISGEDITKKFAAQYKIGQPDEIISWNYEERKLTFNESFKVSGHSGLKNVIFRPANEHYLSVHVGNQSTDKPTYFINKNDGGSIGVCGQLSGSGTIYANGDVIMEAGSQLNAVPDTGVSVYASGNIVINEMAYDPMIQNTGTPEVEEYNTRLSVFQKLNTDGEIIGGAQSNVFIFRSALFSENEMNLMQSDGVIGEYNFFAMYDIEKNQYIGSFNVGENVQAILSSPFSDTPNRGLIKYDGILAGFHPTWTQATAMSPDRVVKIHTKSGLGDLFYRPEIVETKFDDSGRRIKAKDSIFTGLVYAGKNFIANSPAYSFKLLGGLVAHGGNISITAKDCGLTYDTRYLNTSGVTEGINIKTLYWVER